MALVGIQALSYKNSSCHFYVLQKINLQNFSVTWNKINNSLDILISYPSITYTQIKHMLPTSFKFRVNPYIKTVLSKTRENLRLKTRYLKGITTEQLFIISILRGYLKSPLLFIQLLKEIKANQTHSLYFVFIFQITHYNYIYFYKDNFYFIFSYSSFFLIYIKQTKNNKRKEILIWIHGECLLPQAGCCCGCSTRWPDVEVLEQSLPILILLLLLLLEASHLLSHAYLPLCMIV